MYRGTIIFIFISLLLPTITFAQAIDSFSISANPEYPKAGQQTTVSIESFSIDLTRSSVVWKENNIVVAKETGITQKVFISPQNGQTKTISVEVTTPTGFVIKKEYTLSPQAVDILWEAVDSYTPPFYKGKALPGEQSLVRVVAIPNFTSKGTLLDRTQTVYSWSVGGKRSEQDSGYNKSSFVFKFNPLKNSETIKLVASTLSGSSEIQESFVITPYNPEIIFYESNPLLGVLSERAFTDGLQLITKEVTLTAVPYYFSGASNIASNLGFTWTIGGTRVNPGINQNTITLATPEKAGNTVLGVTIKHIEKTLQNAKADLQIIYEK